MYMRNLLAILRVIKQLSMYACVIALYPRCNVHGTKVVFYNLCLLSATNPTITTFLFHTSLPFSLWLCYVVPVSTWTLVCSFYN